MVQQETPRNWLDPQTLTRLSGLDVIARRMVEGYITGLHQSPYHGFSAEFSEYKPYHPGAPLRHLDWRVLGRSERYYVKTFEEETNCRAYLMLDCSASMGYSSHSISKQRYAVWLAAGLAYLLLRQRDAAGLALYNRTLTEWIQPRSVMSHWHTLLKPLHRLEPAGGTATAEILNHLSERLTRRSFVCLFSDLMDQDEATLHALKKFRIRGHELLVFHIMDPVEIRMDLKREAVLEDMETGQRLTVDTRLLAEEYNAAVATWTGALRKTCLDMKADYCQLNTTQPFDQALTAFLAKRKRIGA